jgi:SAM-dependent methyltransferase
MVDRPNRAIPPTAWRSARLRKRIRTRAFYIQSFLNLRNHLILKKIGMNIYHPSPPYDKRAASMLDGMEHYPASDKEIFLAGYSQLCANDLSGGHALEICGGYGDLAAQLARILPKCKVSGLDRYVPDTPKTKKALSNYQNLEYIAGDAFDLSRFKDNSLDLIWGQAALHHLSHDYEGLAKEATRALKPGGRLIFIFEPLGHNLFVAPIRAVRMARAELGDESNLYFSQFERMSTYFSTTDVQVFNLIGYPAKVLSDRFQIISNMFHSIDARLMKFFPKLQRYGANCNLVFKK